MLCPTLMFVFLWILEAQKLGLRLHVGTWDPIWSGPWIECNIEGPGAVQGVGGAARVEAVLKRVPWRNPGGNGSFWSSFASLPLWPLVWSSYVNSRRCASRASTGGGRAAAPASRCAFAFVVPAGWIFT
jgi:hypothetical protein